MYKKEFLKEMAKIDYRPKVLVTFTVGDPVMYKVAGADVWEGTYIALPGNSGVPGAEPAADNAVAILKKMDPKLEGKEYLALFGAASMMHLVQGLKNAGRNLTTESMIKGMEMIKDWKPEGIGAPVTYNPDRHHGSGCFAGCSTPALLTGVTIDLSYLHRVRRGR